MTDTNFNTDISVVTNTDLLTPMLSFTVCIGLHVCISACHPNG